MSNNFEKKVEINGINYLIAGEGEKDNRPYGEDWYLTLAYVKNEDLKAYREKYYLKEENFDSENRDWIYLPKADENTIDGYTIIAAYGGLWSELCGNGTSTEAQKGYFLDAYGKDEVDNELIHTMRENIPEVPESEEEEENNDNN